jgi:hypothetical protein
MRRLFVISMVLVLAACDPVQAVIDGAASGITEPLFPARISWTGATGGRSLEIELVQSDGALTGTGTLIDGSVSPVFTHRLTISSATTQPSGVGAIPDLLFTSTTISDIWLKSALEGGKLVGQLKGGPFTTGTDISLARK